MGGPIPIFAKPGWAYRTIDSEARQRISRATSPSQRALNWPTALFSEEPIGFAGLSAALSTAAGAAEIIVSLSHDHYITMPGGVQNCVGDEQAWASRNGISYLHLCPNAPLPLLGRNGDISATMLMASLDGRRLGLVSFDDVLSCIAEVRHAAVHVRCVVHHMLGFAPEHVVMLHQACGDADNPMLFWIHDLFSLCPSIHLLRNDVAFCHGPAALSQACQICHAGVDRMPHLKRFSDFFTATRPVVLAPSTTILDFWRTKGRYAHTAAITVPPCELSLSSEAPSYRDDRPLRVAFLGAPSYEKGWGAFESLARWHAEDPRYEFFHFGWTPADVPGLRHVTVTVTRENRMAMVDAVKASGIDVVVNWSLCYESFSFTAHEALAAGTYVIVRRGAGHVAHALTGAFADSGCVVDSEVELQAMFVTDALLGQVARARRHYAVLSPGAGAGSILMQSWKRDGKSA